MLFDSVAPGPAPVSEHMGPALAGTVYVLRSVPHVGAVLPADLRSHRAPHVPSDTPQWVSVRACGPGYVVTILGNFVHITSLPAGRDWLLHNPVPTVQCLSREALAVIPVVPACLQLHIHHQSFLDYLRTPDQQMALSAALRSATGCRCWYVLHWYVVHWYVLHWYVLHWYVLHW